MIRMFLAPAVVAALLLAGCGAPAGDDIQSVSSEAPGHEPVPDAAPSLVEVPAGTRFDARLDGPIGSRTSHPGDTFSMTTLEDVIVDGVTAIPAGSRVTGSVVEVTQAPRGTGNARLVLSFGRLTLPDGRSTRFVGSLTHSAGSAETRDDDGARSDTGDRPQLGRILGRDTRGAILGGDPADALGTAVVVSREGEPVALPSGMVLTIDLEKPADFRPFRAASERRQT